MIRLAFGASAGRREPTKKKREKGGGVPATSPMLKLAKKLEKIRKSISEDKVCVPFPYGDFFLFILQFLLDFW